MAQLNLDEEISVGHIDLFNANAKEMYVSLVRYRNRRYISLSRISRDVTDRKTKKKKVVHHNSIWIPISDAQKVAELIWQAGKEAEKRGWKDYIMPAVEQALFEEILEEGEKLECCSPTRKDAKIFLETAADFIRDIYDLKVNVQAIVEKTKMTGIRAIRAIEYLEDAGYIKHVEMIEDSAVSSFAKLLEQPTSFMNSIMVEALDRAVNERAMKICGFEQCDVDAIDYLDDDDPKIKIWHYATKLAEAEVIQTVLDTKVPLSFKITAAGYDWIDK